MRRFAAPSPASLPISNLRARLIALVLTLGAGTFSLRGQTDLASLRAQADKGDPEALTALGTAYATGQGVGQSYAEALRYYRDAANRGNAQARYDVASMLEDGRGIERDEPAAAGLYRAAALQNFGPAQSSYGLMLAEGRGGLKASPAEAYAWLTLAAENGARSTGRDLLAQKLDPDQLADGKARVIQLREDIATQLAQPQSVVAPAPPVAAAPAPGKQIDTLTAANRELSIKVDELTAANQTLQAQQMTSARIVAEVPKLRSDLMVAREAQKADHDRFGQAQVELVKAKRAADRASALNAELTATKQELVAAKLSAQRAHSEAAKAVAQGEEAKTPPQKSPELTPSPVAVQPTESSGEREARTKLAAQLDESSRALEKKTKDFDTLRAANDALQHELAVAQQNLATARSTAEAKAKPVLDVAMKRELEVTQEKLRALEAQEDEDRASAARDVAALAGQLERSREANKSLAEANRLLIAANSTDNAGADSETAALKVKLAALTAENEKLQAGEQSAAGEIEKLRAEKSATEQATLAAKNAAAVPVVPVASEASTHERENFTAQLDAATAKLAAAEHRAADAEKAGQSATTLAQRAQAELEQARTENATLTARVTELGKADEQQRGSAGDLTAKVAQLASERDALGAQLAAAKQSSDQSATQGATLAQLTSDNAKLRDELKETNAKLDLAQADTARSAQATTDLAALRSQLTDAQAKLADSAKAAEEHDTSATGLAAANVQLKSERDDFKKQLDDQAALLVKLRADSDQLAQAEAARSSAEQRAAALADTASQLATLQRENAGLRAENARVGDAAKSADREHAARIAQLQRENAALNGRLRQAQTTFDQIANAARVINGGSPVASTFSSSPTSPTASTAPVAAPSSAPAVPAARVHIVQEGESLTRISLRYYGTASRWPAIYEANRETLSAENALRPGQRLKIP